MGILSTTEKGDLAVAMLTAKFLKRRFVVLRPVSEMSRYDLVIDRGNGFETVQCKCASYRNGCLIFASSSSHYHRNAATSRTYRGDCDLFGVYSIELDMCCLVPVLDVGQKKGYLRIDDVRTGRQRKSGLPKTTLFSIECCYSSAVERALGKGEAKSSILFSSTTIN